jgi:Xaa-Pro dipeptidase
VDDFVPPLAFAEQEFRDRIVRARREMASRELSALVITTPENLYYLTGYSTPAYYSTQAMVLPLEGDPFLVTYVVEAEVVRKASIVRDFATYGPNDEPVPVLAAAIRERGLVTPRLGIEMRSWFFPVALYRQLLEALGVASLVDGSGVVEAIRPYKSDAEVAYIREGARVAGVAMAAAREAVTAGNTENDVAAAIYSAGIREGCEFPGSPPYVNAGPRVLLPHASWDRRRIAAGDQVYVELSGCVRRYSAALMRTFSLGEPHRELRRLEEAINGGLDAGIAALRPGATSGEVDEACRGFIRKHGYEYPHETGYSIGVCFPPGWNETHVFNLKPGDERVIQPNMTFHLVPHVDIPGIGTVGLSETVLVTADGPEVLTKFPREMVVG